MRKDILMILLGVFIGLTIANGYFVLSGNYPPSPVKAIPYNFTMGSIAVIFSLIVTSALIVSLRKEVERLNLEYVSKILAGFFSLGSWDFLEMEFIQAL